MIELFKILAEVCGEPLRCVGCVRFHGAVRRVNHPLLPVQKTDAALLADLGKILVNTGDQRVCGLGDGFQAVPQLREGAVLAPCGDIAEAVLAGFDAVILAHGIGNALGLDLFCILVLRLGSRAVCPGSGLRLRPLTVMQERMAHFVNGGAYGLDLAHAGTHDDLLLTVAEIPVQGFPEGLDFKGDRRRAAQRLHKCFKVLHIPGQVRGKVREGLALGLRHVKHLHRLKHGDFNDFFLNNGISVRVQHGEVGVRVHLFLFDSFFERRGRDDRNAGFALFHMASKLVFPLVKARDHGGVGHLHVNEDRVVDGVIVEPGHGTQVFGISLALKQLLYAVLNTGDDLFHSVPIADCRIWHDGCSPFCECCPIRGKFPQIDRCF